MAKRKTGEFNLRIVHLPVVLTAQAVNGEVVPTWPDPPATLREYYAARDALSGGEQIVQGLNQSTGAEKWRIKGRAIPMSVSDRLKKKYTGELFNVTGVMRDTAETIINVERVHQQTTKQEGGQ